MGLGIILGGLAVLGAGAVGFARAMSNGEGASARRGGSRAQPKEQPPRSGSRVWSWAGRIGESQSVVIDLQTPAVVGASYRVRACVELSHFMGSSTDQHWPGGSTYNFVEQVDLLVLARETAVDVLSAAEFSDLCTFVLVQPPAKPVGDFAQRFPIVMQHPERDQAEASDNRGPWTPATGTRPTFDVLVDGGRLKLQVRAAPLAEWNDENGGFRNPTRSRKYTVRWACKRVADPPSAPASPGGQSGGGQSAGG